MTEQEFIQQAEGLKGRLYRTAWLYLGSEACAVDAVDEAEAFDALPLREAVARLPRELRAVVVLRYFQGLTLAETAQALDIPPGTVSTRQRKALSLLKLHLTEEV